MQTRLILTAGLVLGLGLCACQEHVGNGNPNTDAAVPVPDADAAAPLGDSAVDAQPGNDAVCPLCESYGAVTVDGTVTTDLLTETSGIVASRRHEGVFYTHNDSGDEARFFAIDLSGALRAELILSGASAQDWEDLAVGPCDAASCVFLGDIGDNAESRSVYSVFAVTEPDSLDASIPTGVPWKRYQFRYPDGSHNAETLLVHPQTGDYYVVTKTQGTSGVYRLPQPFNTSLVATLEHVSDLTLPLGSDALVTGGDLHPCGGALLLRTYTRVIEYRLAPGAAFETIFSSTGVFLPSASEAQGEAVAWLPDGLGYVTVSEGLHPPLNAVRCQ